MQVIKRFMSALVSIVLAFPLILAPAHQEITFADGYNGASLENSVFTSIPFSRKEEEEILIDGGMPLYYDISSRTNTCANVAGAIVMGYYDKTYDELIENFTSARVIRDKVLYAKQTQEVENTMARLYTTMKTNITEGGTTVANFKTGLQTYINEQGRKVSYSQVIKNETLEVESYKRAIQNNRPVVLFVSKYTLISTLALDAETGAEEFYKQLYTGNHTVVCYGMRTIRYYDASGKLTDQMDLLLVATGYNHSPTGYIMIDDYGTLVDGYEVNVF